MHDGERLTATLFVALLVATAGCGGFGGSTDAPTDTDTTTTDAVTDTRAEDSTAGGGTTDRTPSETVSATATEDATGGIDESSFTSQILTISTINDTAREVTVRLTNEQNGSAENVVVDTVIYAGNTTADDQQVWTGTEELGTLSVTPESSPRLSRSDSTTR